MTAMKLLAFAIMFIAAVSILHSVQLRILTQQVKELKQR